MQRTAIFASAKRKHHSSSDANSQLHIFNRSKIPNRPFATCTSQRAWLPAGAYLYTTRCCRLGRPGAPPRRAAGRCPAWPRAAARLPPSWRHRQSSPWTSAAPAGPRGPAPRASAASAAARPRGAAPSPAAGHLSRGHPRRCCCRRRRPCPCSRRAAAAAASLLWRSPCDGVAAPVLLQQQQQSAARVGAGERGRRPPVPASSRPLRVWTFFLPL